MSISNLIQSPQHENASGNSLHGHVCTHPALFHDKAYKYLTILDAEEINIQELESMLQDVAGGMMRAGRRYDSWLRKDIRILDFLKYHDKVR